MVTSLIALMLVAVAPGPTLLERAGTPESTEIGGIDPQSRARARARLRNDVLSARALQPWVSSTTHAWVDDGWSVKLRYVVATNLDLLATARGDVDLMQMEWGGATLYARTDLRVRSWDVLASIERGIASDAVVSSLVLGSQFSFSTPLPLTPALGVKMTAAPVVLSIRSVKDVLAMPMQALIYIQLR